MAIICRGTSEIKGHGSWRIPYGLFFVIPSILAVAVWWIPEVSQLDHSDRFGANRCSRLDGC